MKLRRKYENGLQTIVRVDYAKYPYKILVFFSPTHIAIRYKHLICLKTFDYICTYVCIRIYIYRVDREGWWFEHSVSWLRVYLSAEGAKNVS